MSDRPADTYVSDEGSTSMEYAPLKDEDATMLKNELMRVGELASNLMSRAHRENNESLTEAFDKVAQRLTGTYLDLFNDLKVYGEGKHE